MVPSALEPNTVVSVLQKGYTIADRILRPALVTVAAPFQFDIQGIMTREDYYDD